MDKYPGPLIRNMAFGHLGIGEGESISTLMKIRELSTSCEKSENGVKYVLFPFGRGRNFHMPH